MGENTETEPDPVFGIGNPIRNSIIDKSMMYRRLTGLDWQSEAPSATRTINRPGMSSRSARRRPPLPVITPAWAALRECEQDRATWRPPHRAASHTFPDDEMRSK